MAWSERGGVNSDLINPVKNLVTDDLVDLIRINQYD